MIYMRAFQILLLAGLAFFELTADGIEPSATVHVPMRDGTTLSTDLYYPEGSPISDQLPCILLRLPGGRKAEPWVQLANLANAGFVVAIQDTRSALDKEGKTVPYFSDGWDSQRDGHDTIDWLAASSFTNGKIGTIGFSAAGITQILLAPMAPAALKCQYIGQAPASLYHHAIYPGGGFQKNQVEVWFSLYAPHPSVLELVRSQPDYNLFWKRVDSASVADKVEVPALHYGGWYDPFIQGTLDSFTSRQQEGGKGAKGTQKLVIGPWNHFWPQDLTLGDFKVPEKGLKAPIDMSPQQWFNHYLKGADNEIAKMPVVTYFVMGPFDGSASSGNQWRHANSWPVPVSATSFYLTADKTLSKQSDEKDLAFAYAHDPENPVPTIGGRNIFLPSGPKDQRPNEGRQDVLVFTSTPLSQDVEVTGQILLKLYVASLVSGIDLAINLTDVYPDGKSVLIAEGIRRLDVSAQQKGQPQEVGVDLWSTSFVFAKGHSIRLTVAGSNYPHYEKSDRKVTAESKDCQILVGKKTPSRLILPIPVAVGTQR